MLPVQTVVGSFDSGDMRYGPWLSRRGNAATLGCKVVGVATTGTSTVRAMNLKQPVRLQCTAIPLAGNTTWLHFRVLPAAWETN